MGEVKEKRIKKGFFSLKKWEECSKFEKAIGIVYFLILISIPLFILFWWLLGKIAVLIFPF